MSETIPADILSAAAAVVERGYDTGLIDAVAAALMAERERCAKIAENDPELPGDPPVEWRDMVRTVGPIENARSACRATKHSIATSIRTPSTGEEQ